MAKKIQEPKIILEREYTVPLRSEWQKVPEYKRAAKAVKALKQFIARHMKIYDRDLRKIKVDIVLNNEIRFRGIRKPPAKIKILAKKFDNDIVKVELVNIPTHIKFQKIREEKKKNKIKNKTKKETKQETKKEKKEEDTKEKENAAKEETMKLAKKKAQEQKHTSVEKKIVMHRKDLSR